MKLLIGYDGSECAKAAIEDLVLAGLPADVDAMLLSVADMLIKVPYEEYNPPKEAEDHPTAKLVRTARALAAAAMNDAREASLEGVGLVATLFPGWNVKGEAVADSPYWALIKAAEEHGSDLILVGSHGRSGFKEMFLGSVSQNVLSHASFSVRIGRTRTRSADQPPRILVGSDGSRNACAAIDRLLKREWPEGSEFRVVTAVDPQLSMAIAYHFACGDPTHQDADVTSAARHHAESLAQRLAQAGLSATALVELADPKHLLIEEAARWNADGIFIGAKGHSRLERFLLGSVSAAVAARAHCTVEVVRMPNASTS
jgi:nucleotide-binding universal stress UspA family protein